MAEDTKKIHTRTISVTTGELGDGTLLVEGELRDDRFCPSFVYTAQKFVEPGIIHHFAVRWVLSLPGPVIRSVEVDMKTVPNELCRESAGILEKLVGLAIKPGFTQAVNQLIGGIRGCTHLTNLIHSMASAAVQGQWAFYLRKRDDSIQLPEFNSGLLVNSCWLWREDGPHFRHVRKLEEGRRKLIITIDGPAGSGKSTIGRRIADIFSYTYLDTGALYRALAYKVLTQGIPPEDEQLLEDLCGRTSISFDFQGGVMAVRVDGEDVTDRIRTEEVGACASAISATPAVRRALLPLQREAGASGGIVAEGRDMGTVVFPDADVKFYLDADVRERARRRHRELEGKGTPSNHAEIEHTIIMRDRQDRGRAVAPLRPPAGAVVIDSTGMDIDAVVDAMAAVIRTAMTDKSKDCN